MERISEKHAELLKELYETTLHRGVPLSSDGFVDFIDGRIHVEYMRQVFLGNRDKNPDYRKFIETEVYLEGIWMEQNGRYSDDLWQASGEERRLRITLQCLVNRTIVLFREIGMDINRQGENEELDIRCDLSKYDRVD